MTRTINAPGIEYNEIDRSQYNLKQDNSIVGTTSFICGFADKGEDYTTQWINSIQTLQETYGVPTNEPEKYFYNAGVEILNKGGVLLMSKLPYDNESKDKFTYVDYKINSQLCVINEFSNLHINEKYDTLDDLRNTLSNILDTLKLQTEYSINTIKNIQNVTQELINNYTPELIDISQFDTIEHIKNSISSFINNIQLSGKYNILNILDPYLTSYINIDPHPYSATQYITLHQLDELEIGNKTALANNTIRIVDITRSEYSTVETNCIETVTINNQTIEKKWTNDCLGIVPIIVSPINALYFQNSSDPLLSGVQVNDFNVISNMTSLEYKSSSSTKINLYTDALRTQYSISLNSNDILNETISKIAATSFPTILYLNNMHFDPLYLKDIYVMVFKAYADSANKQNVSFKLLESFSGSLDQTAKDPITKRTRFIENIVNSSSKYIRLYSKVDQTIVQRCSTVGIFNQTAKSLGFYKEQCKKRIHYKNSIIDPLTLILNQNSDRNTVPIDLVIDAGTSNLAQLAYEYSKTNKLGNVDFTTEINIKDKKWKFDLTVPFDTHQTAIWNKVLTMYDTFCKSTRKDCMFIADGLRTFCIEGDSKIIRSTNKLNTIKNNILPKLRYMTCLNSSYSAGYCDWFYAIDAYTTDLFWIPPSIKAAGVYTFTDAYYHTWDAPAGIIRGKINNVVDCAFIPNLTEAGKIYDQCWNYAINYPNDGIALEGQKTMQIQQTAFDRINVRRLFLYLEKTVVRYSKYFLYQGNTEYLRSVFVDTLTPIFENVKTGNGLLEYYIRCDNTNNTTQTIENNELHCQIIVKPVKTIEFIVLDFVCTTQAATVTETILTK